MEISSWNFKKDRFQLIIYHSRVHATISRGSVFPDLPVLWSSNGLEDARFQPGPASLIGYPIVARRIWPRTSNWLWMWRELWADVTQQVSIGNVWKENDEYLDDMDSISGNSGGPVIQDGKVIGAIHLLKSCKGEGYRYKSPSLNFILFETVKAELIKAEN